MCIVHPLSVLHLHFAQPDAKRDGGEIAVMSNAHQVVMVRMGMDAISAQDSVT